MQVNLKQAHVDDYAHSGTGNEGDIVAPMNGSLIACMVEANQQVQEGDALLVVEAMKMEHTIYAPCAGLVTEIYYQVGDLVAADAQLLHLEVEEA